MILSKGRNDISATMGDDAFLHGMNLADRRFCVILHKISRTREIRSFALSLHL